MWSVLAFQAGWINAGGFLASHRFVSHVTGFATQFGYDVALSKWKDAFGMLTVPLFFLGGAMMAAYYVDRPLNQNKKGQFHILLLLIGIFLAAVTVLGVSGVFGAFGQELDIYRSYLMIALLCLSSGMQNAGTTTASNGFVRTTHLTGITTDLGIGLVRNMQSHDEQKRSRESSRNQVRMLVVLFFAAGSVISSVIFIEHGFIGFIVPSCISFVLYMVAKKEYEKRA